MSIRVVGYTPEGRRIVVDEGPQQAVTHQTTPLRQVVRRAIHPHATGDRLGLPGEKRDAV